MMNTMGNKWFDDSSGLMKGGPENGGSGDTVTVVVAIDDDGLVRINGLTDSSMGFV